MERKAVLGIMLMLFLVGALSMNINETQSDFVEEWVPYVPSSQMLDLKFWMSDGTSYINATITFPDSGYMISDWGTIMREGYEIWIISEIWDWTGYALFVITIMSHTYELGHLEEGNYTFTFMTRDYLWDVKVKSINFTVVGVVEPTTWTVDDYGPADFSSIQEAINAASPGDIIYVYAGLYYEHVVVNKTVQLEAVPPREYTFIDGNRTPGTVVTITADNVVVVGFKILNSGSQPEDAGIRLDSCQGTIIEANILMDNSIGISLVDSDNNTLKSNHIDDCEYCSIDLSNSHNNVIKYNYMRKHGIQLCESDSNTLYRNRVFKAEYGISLKGNHNNITSNEFGSNTIGINLQSNHSIIVRNEIRSSLQYGIMLSGRYNIIYHNNFVNNTKQIRTDSINFWDDGYPSGGNYWSDHPSVDWYSGPNQDVLGSDGIGDSPYVIDAYNLDRYPLMMWPPPLIVLSLYPPTSTALVGETFTINITVADVVISEIPPVSNGLFGWEAWMTFDPSVVHAVNATEGPFLKSAGYDTVWSWRINNTEGTVRVGASIYEFPYPPTGSNGSGVLATLTFEAVSEGATSLHFEIPKWPAKTNLYTVVANNVIKIGDVFPVFIADGLVTVPESPLVPADLDIVPKTLNLRSKGKWITVHIEFSEDSNTSDIDRTTIVLNDTVPVDPFWMDKPLKSVIGDHDDDGVADLMVKFDRQAVIEYLKTKGITDAEVTLAITGETNGTSFEVTDTIKVIGQ